MAEPMPTSYETRTTTSSGPQIGFQRDYVKTIPGILKIVEMVLDLIVIICVSVSSHINGGEWVNFVAASAIITTLILFIFHILGLISRLPGPWTLIEFIYYCVYVALYLIAAIVAAAFAARIASMGAAAFFAFAATATYAVDAFFMFRRWRSGSANTTTETHTTTVTTVESTSY